MAADERIDYLLNADTEPALDRYGHAFNGAFYLIVMTSSAACQKWAAQLKGQHKVDFSIDIKERGNLPLFAGLYLRDEETWYKCSFKDLRKSRGGYAFTLIYLKPAYLAAYQLLTDELVYCGEMAGRKIYLFKNKNPNVRG